MAGYQLGQKHFGLKHMMGAKLAAIKHLMGASKSIHPMIQHEFRTGGMYPQLAPTLSGMKRSAEMSTDELRNQ